MDRRKKISPELIRLIRFGIVGVSNTLVDWAVFWLLLSGLEMHYVAAQTFAYLCGTLNSFLWNRRWTFASKGPFKTAEAVKFFLVNGICLASSYALLFVCMDVFDWNTLFSKLVVTILLLMVNYAASRLWVFKSPDSANKASSEG
ncbi:GtrA family protein [Paenibacillus lutrae]|uniref:GtrA family protein n=1 Tax=Paenibacillus lutrae TaxID=2078573 RepID=A0A7X3FFA7_9BACL|nr:GtrA family protein [Paenibacillus lutrae]MVO98665.1 GtrA family protein [Paenibacillus lutrae]